MTAVPSQCGAGFEMSAFVHCRLCPDALVSVCTAPPEKRETHILKAWIMYVIKTLTYVSYFNRHMIYFSVCSQD